MGQDLDRPLGLDQNHADAIERWRAIDQEIAARENVVSMPREMVVCERELKECLPPRLIAFEYRRKGVLLYRKAVIKLPDGSRQFRRDRKGAKTILWGLDSIEQSRNLIITEGEFDRLAILTAGLGPAVSVPDGAQSKRPGEHDIEPWDDKGFEWLWNDDRLIDELQSVERIILAVDSDRAGKVLAGELAIRLGRDRCLRVTWPTGTKDANDVLKQHGPEVLKTVIQAAQPVVPDRLVTMGAFDDLQAPEELDLGVRGLEPHIKPCAPELMVVTGPPNHGKSQFALWMAGRMVKEHGIRAAYLQFEDNPTRNIADLTRFAVNHIDTVQHSTQARDWIEEHWRFICPSERISDQDLDLKWLEDTIQTAAQRHGCRVLIVDPWNEIEHTLERHETLATYLNRALRLLKQLARRYRLCLIVVAHPDKQSGQSKSLDEWSLYGIDGGAAWNNKADHGVVVLMDEDRRSVSVKICKSKDWERMGAPGVVKMRFMRNTCAYAVDNGDEPILRAV